MHFSNTAQDQSSKFTKIAIVTAIHVALGAAILGMKVEISPEPANDPIMVEFTPEKLMEPPPPPPEPPKQPQQKVTQPMLIAPPVEVKVEQVPLENTVVAQVTNEPQPEAIPGPTTPEIVAPPAQNTGKIYEAALADANACAKPDYPAKAARNGETGTVALALLIGTDGRVSDSKVQKSSGSRELDRAALAALSLCKFKPAMNNGSPEAAWGRIAYVWTLDS
ncbi:MAG: energy transducer TonB [Pseudomonadota bacterium]